MEQSRLEEVVRDNLMRIRRNTGMTQGKFADIIGLKRTSYTKKELGRMAILLKDLDALLENMDISLVDIFKGYPRMVVPGESGLSEQAVKKFPFLQKIVELAEEIAAENGDEADYRFMREHLIHGIAQMDKQLKKT